MHNIFKAALRSRGLSSCQFSLSLSLSPLLSLLSWHISSPVIGRGGCLALIGQNKGALDHPQICPVTCGFVQSKSPAGLSMYRECSEAGINIPYLPTSFPGPCPPTPWLSNNMAPPFHVYYCDGSEKFRKSDRTYHGYFSGGALDSERSGVILHPGQKMKWDEWRERYNNWLAGTTDEDEIWCPGCPTLFFSYDLLRKHMTTEHTVSKSFRHYYTGVAAVVPKDFSCDQCGSKFTKSSDLQRHVDSIHIMQEYIRCELCAMKFSRWDSYKRHKLRIHDSSEKNICGNCGMKYESAGALMKHIGRKCSSSLTCEKCASKFSRTSDLKRHQKSTIVITCDICGQKVCNGKVLKEHVKSEHGDSVKNFSCGICGQSFTLKKSLDLHVKKSVFIPCYDCGDILCNKRAYNMHSYNIHGKKLWINWTRLLCVIYFH